MRGFITAGTLAIVLATTGLAALAGGGGSNDYGTQFDANGHGTPRGSLER